MYNKCVLDLFLVRQTIEKITEFLGMYVYVVCVQIFCTFYFYIIVKIILSLEWMMMRASVKHIYAIAAVIKITMYVHGWITCIEFKIQKPINKIPFTYIYIINYKYFTKV